MTRSKLCVRCLQIGQTKQDPTAPVTWFGFRSRAYLKTMAVAQLLCYLRSNMSLSRLGWLKYREKFWTKRIAKVCRICESVVQKLPEPEMALQQQRQPWQSKNGNWSHQWATDWAWVGLTPTAKKQSGVDPDYSDFNITGVAFLWYDGDAFRVTWIPWSLVRCSDPFWINVWAVKLSRYRCGSVELKSKWMTREKRWKTEMKKLKMVQ